MTETREGTDVVERLSFSASTAEGVTTLDFHAGGCRPATSVEIECLREITRLRAENKRLREALNAIDALDPEGHSAGFSADALLGLVTRMGGIARAALKEPSNG